MSRTHIPSQPEQCLTPKETKKVKFEVGMLWQCDCGLIYRWTYHAPYYFIPCFWQLVDLKAAMKRYTEHTSSK